VLIEVYVMSNIAEPDDINLRKLLDKSIELANLSDDMCQDVEFKFIDDDQTLMALAFVSKETDLLRSLCTLIENKHHRDGQLIARSMLEGLGHLLLASKDPNYAHKWRAYVFVADFKLILEKEGKHEVVDPLYKLHIIKQLDTEGKQFYSTKARKALQDDQALLPDPYKNENKWAGMDIAAIYKRLERQEIYDSAYRDMSGWVHWGISGLTKAIDFKDTNIQYKSQLSDVTARNTLIVGFEAMWEAARVLNSFLIKTKKAHLVPRFDKNLSKLLDDYRNAGFTLSFIKI